MPAIHVSYATLGSLIVGGANGAYFIEPTNQVVAVIRFNSDLFTSKVGEEGDVADFLANMAPRLTAAGSVNDAFALASYQGPAKASNQVNQNASNVVIVNRRGGELVMSTHNYCDPTTWYTESVRVVAEALVDSGDGLTFASAHSNWIDLTHGKVWDEDALCLDVPHGYSVAVTVDGAPVAARLPFAASGGAYTVDYVAGTITFAAPQAGAVVATYSYANGSMWRLEPDPGKVLVIESAKAMWSADMDLRDSVVSDTLVYNPYDLPNKVVVKTTQYKTIQNILVEAAHFFPAINALPGARGTPGMQAAQYRYGTVIELSSAIGIETRVRLGNNIPCGGTQAAVTFYCTVTNV